MQHSGIYIIAELRIFEGKLERFREIAQNVTSGVLANEPDTLEYLWHINETGTICFAAERYPHSKALLHHLLTSGPALGDLFDVCTVDAVSIYGSVDDDVMETFKQFPFETQYCNDIIGFSK